MAKCSIEELKVAQQKSLGKVGAFNEKGKLLGSADFSVLQTDKKFVWLHEIEVIPECRRKGIGEALIDVVADIGRNNNAKLVYAYPSSPVGVEKPLPINKIRHFYEKNGFKPCNPPKDVVTVTDDGLAKRGVCLLLK